MADAYLLFEAGGFRLLLAVGEVAHSLAEAPVEWSDLSVSLGGAPAEAWVGCVGGVNLGVNRIVGLVDLAADAFALLAPGDFVDAVTLLPMNGARSFRVSPRGMGEFLRYPSPAATEKGSVAQGLSDPGVNR